MSITSESSDSAGPLLIERQHDRRSPSRQPDGLQQLYGPVADELRAVEDILREELVSRYPHVNKLLQHGVRIGGKRLRPALLLLVAKACGQLEDAHLLLAAVLEMIHTATLVHDDVLDAATLRRHQATVNAHAGNAASVLLGDYLFSHSFYLASTLDNTFACQRIGRTTNIVCEGEMRQINSCGDYDLAEQDYLEIIDAKTAALCACCCELGSHYSGANADTQANMRGYGRNLGMAFQITDDLLDVMGDESQTGKSLGTDFGQGKMTLPLIRLLQLADEADQAEIRALQNRPVAQRCAVLLRHLDSTDAVAYTRQRALDYATAAQDCLKSLPASAARDVLFALPDFVVAREM